MNAPKAREPLSYFSPNRQCVQPRWPGADRLPEMIFPIDPS